MEKRLEKYIFLFILLLVVFPYSMDEKNQLNNSKGVVRAYSRTELNISHSYLNYQIESTGEYLCYFTIEAIGNNYTVDGSASCLFTITDPYVEDLSLSISDSPIQYNLVQNNSGHFVSFSIINQTYPVGFPFSIQGSFIGNFSSTSSNINSYSFGMNWGTLVGYQKTTLTFDGQKYSILGSVNPTPHATGYMGLGILKLTWTETLVQGFSGTIHLQLRQIVEKCLIFDFKSWNATLGQTVVISVRNNCTFQIEGVVGVPNWINTNVSHFVILPNQSISISFVINPFATLGMNGSIEFIVYEPIYEINIISVTIIDEKLSNTLPNNLMTIIILSSIFIGSLAIGVSYYNRDYINAFISNVSQSKCSLKRLKTADPSWETIKSRREPILPNQELKVLEILFHQGALNQKSLANQLDVSTMTMSRIISRLETKRLLRREPVGMSNMIWLNKEKL